VTIDFIDESFTQLTLIFAHERADRESVGVTFVPCCNLEHQLWAVLSCDGGRRFELVGGLLRLRFIHPTKGFT
jgi:hypothetical protein